MCNSFYIFLNLNINWLLAITIELDLIIVVNLTGQTRDRCLLGYDLRINVLVKPSTVTNSPNWIVTFEEGSESRDWSEWFVNSSWN